MGIMKSKVCTKCKANKILKEFGVAKHHSDGLKSWCKECSRTKYRHQCSDCTNNINGKNSVRCKSCAGKHIYDIKGRNKYNCADCGTEITYGHIRCKKCNYEFKVGKNAPNYKGVDYRCNDCGKEIANMYAKRCQSCSSKGKRNSHFGIKPKHTKRIYFKNQCFRSIWETNFAKWCDGSGIKWEYESKTFDLGNSTYTPDFYLSEFDCWVEIKGWWFPENLKKFNLFKRLYPLINIKVFNKKLLKKIGII